MDCNKNNVSEIVRKFWEGQTSLEEEQALAKFVASDECPDEYIGLAEYFSLAQDDYSDILGQDFDDEIINKINKNDRKGWSLNPNWKIYAAAAAIAFLVGIYFWNNQTPAQPQMAEQEVSKEEIDKAFQQTKNAMFLISNKLNKGSQTTQHVRKMNQIGIQSIKESK